MLDKRISPDFIKGLTLEEQRSLAADLRKYIIECVSKNGGHLASNLGTVELIVALHSVFTTPKDKIIFDVGHQSYAHKIITGRFDEFKKIRISGGISGYPRPSESVHDAFVAGHSGISISAALGFAEAKLILGEEGKVIAVAGDGSFTNGEIYEALNNLRKRYNNLIVILNDNEMSISKNSGAFAAYFQRLRQTVKYPNGKAGKTHKLKEIKFDKSPPQGNSAPYPLFRGRGIGLRRSHLKYPLDGVKQMVKGSFVSENIFENLGFKYYGIIDGHNLLELAAAFNHAKVSDEPVFIHVKTKKGKGFIPAENNSAKHHAIAKTATPPNKAHTFSEVFGRTLLFLGGRDKKITAVTAAMKYATGCNYFAKQYKERFFDVGIAEGHAITFAFGLSEGGMTPVAAIYSTFLQRCYDQLIHDGAIEKSHIVLAIDRAGLVGEDGETHQGTFDVPMLSAIPGSVIYSPSNADELRLCLERAIYSEKGIVALRYPRGYAKNAEYAPVSSDFSHSGYSNKILIVTYGRLYYTVKRLSLLGADYLTLVKIKPISDNALNIIAEYKRIFFVEESEERGGIGEHLLLLLHKSGWQGEYEMRGVKGFVPYGDIEAQFRFCGLDYYSLGKFIFDKEVPVEKRLDIVTAERSVAKSRTAAQELIKKGAIAVNGKIITKPSQLIQERDVITLVGELPKYVSRGGYKLEKALNYFSIDLTAKICLDIGASTGGFTDCMLQQGAMTVYTVDVGTNQLDDRLKSDKRVISFEQLDIRQAEDVILKKFDFISVDVSFISLKLVIPKIMGFMSDKTTVIALIKPQFEVGKRFIKNGIVSGKTERKEVVDGIQGFIKELGYNVFGVIPTDTVGDMNEEYLICFSSDER